jgi:hypothetical protein
MASIDALHAILDKAHEGKTPKQLMSLPPSALAGVTDGDAKKRNCSPSGELGFYASRGSGTPSRVRRMAWSASIDLRRAVSTTDLTLA